MSSEHEKLPPHWRFALEQAYARLEQLVWGFDFTEEVGKHIAYVGVQEPDSLIGIIDGLLSDWPHMFGGNIAGLEQMRTAIQETIAPAYRAGQEAARQWAATDLREKYEKVANSDPIIAEARKRVPGAFGPSAASWFVEGFCRTVGEEWVKGVIESESTPPPPSPLSPP